MSDFGGPYRVTVKADDDMWKPGGTGTCWVCGKPTEWAYLDQDWQHPDCDFYPVPGGFVTIVGGELVECRGDDDG